MFFCPAQLQLPRHHSDHQRGTTRALQTLNKKYIENKLSHYYSWLCVTEVLLITILSIHHKQERNINGKPNTGIIKCQTLECVPK